MSVVDNFTVFTSQEEMGVRITVFNDSGIMGSIGVVLRQKYPISGSSDWEILKQDFDVTSFLNIPAKKDPEDGTNARSKEYLFEGWLVKFGQVNLCAELVSI